MNQEIHVSQLAETLSNGDYKLIDVREHDELLETGFVPGALHHPMSTFDSEVDTLDKDETYLVICRAGGRSAKVQQYMQGLGYKAINVAGGMDEYVGPVEKF